MGDIEQNLSMDDLDNILRQLYHNKRMESYEFMGIKNLNESLSYLLKIGYICQDIPLFYLTVKGKSFARTRSFNNNSSPIVLC